MARSPHDDPPESSPAKARRPRNDGAVYFEHEPGTECRDERYHRPCTGRWRGEVLISNRAGKRIRKRVSARTKTELYERLKDLKDELGQGVRSSATYTFEEAVDDWLATLADKAAKTITTNREILDPLLAEIGPKTVLRNLQADDVIRALTAIAETRSTRTLQDTKAALVRVITYAQARNLVARNVASLIKAPPGQAPGRPSRSLTVHQAKAADEDRLAAYFILSLQVGVRTEETRALMWDHVDLDGDPDAKPPVPPHVNVWRSVRAHGDVKTTGSLAVPSRCLRGP